MNSNFFLANTKIVNITEAFILKEICKRKIVLLSLNIKILIAFKVIYLKSWYLNNVLWKDFDFVFIKMPFFQEVINHK